MGAVSKGIPVALLAIFCVFSPKVFAQLRGLHLLGYFGLDAGTQAGPSISAMVLPMYLYNTGKLKVLFLASCMQNKQQAGTADSLQLTAGSTGPAFQPGNIGEQMIYQRGIVLEIPPAGSDADVTNAVNYARRS